MTTPSKSLKTPTTTYTELQNNGLKYVTFSVFETVSDGDMKDDTDPWIVTDHRQEIAVKGPCTFRHEASVFFTDKKKNDPTLCYTSSVVTNPTWLDIARLADAMIEQTGDFHHNYLEGIGKRRDGSYYFMMGS